MEYGQHEDAVTAALEAVLLFHSGDDWDARKRYAWLVFTGTTEATTKVLCDTVRKALLAHMQGHTWTP